MTDKLKAAAENASQRLADKIMTSVFSAISEEEVGNMINRRCVEAMLEMQKLGSQWAREEVLRSLRKNRWPPHWKYCDEPEGKDWADYLEKRWKEEK